VKFNNTINAPLFAVDNVNGQQQINFQVPWELSKLGNYILGIPSMLGLKCEGATESPLNVSADRRHGIARC
jgi:hypothetical protein